MAITPGMLFGQSYHNSCPQHQDSRDRSGSKVSTARRRYIAARSAPGPKVRSPVSAGQVGPHRNVRGWQILAIAHIGYVLAAWLIHDVTRNLQVFTSIKFTSIHRIAQKRCRFPGCVVKSSCISGELLTENGEQETGNSLAVNGERRTGKGERLPTGARPHPFKTPTERFKTPTERFKTPTERFKTPTEMF